jgi:hypothetical protein
MRITERELRRIVKQEILREQSTGDTPVDDKTALADVTAAIDRLEPFIEKYKTTFQKINTAPEVAQLVHKIANLFEKMIPSLEGKITPALSSATGLERKETAAQNEGLRRRAGFQRRSR